MKFYRLTKPVLTKKYLQFILLGFFTYSCEVDDIKGNPWRSRTSTVDVPPQYYQQPRVPQYYNPYNNGFPASRRYYDPYQYRQVPSPYGGPNPYYDYDQYYVPPTQYYNYESPIEMNSIGQNKS